MILVVAEGDAWLDARALVLAGEGDGGRVEVDATGLELEVLDDAKGEAKEHAPATFGRECVEGPRDPVVVDRGLLGL